MMQEKLQQKIHYTGNAKYIKDTLKVLDNDNNILETSKYNVEWIDKKDDNTIDENGNDNSGIANKVVTNLLSREDWVIEEEEFKKKTKLDISKESLKQNVKDR